MTPTAECTSPKWGHRLEQAILALVCLWVVLVIVDLTMDVTNGCAIAAGVLALLRLGLCPDPAEDRRGSWLLVGLLAAYVGAGFLSMALAAPIPGCGRLSFRNVHLTSAFVAVAVSMGLRSRRNLVLIFGLLLAAAGIWHAAGAGSVLWREAFLHGRLRGFRGWHSVLGSELLLVTALGLAACVMVRNRRANWALGAGMVLAAALLLLNQTRAALLTLAFVSIPLVMLLQKRWGSPRGRLLAAGLWCFVAVPGLGVAWLALAPSAQRDLTSPRDRLEAHRIALQIGAREPWYRVVVGNGPASHMFVAAARYYQAGDLHPERDLLVHAHNTLLQVFVESGVLGAGLLAAVWCVALLLSLRAWRAAAPGEEWLPGALVTALVSAAVLGQMNHVQRQVPEAIIWLVVGMALALRPRGSAKPAALPK